VKRRTFVSLLVYPADRTATLSGHEVGHDIDERRREGPAQEHETSLRTPSPFPIDNMVPDISFPTVTTTTRTETRDQHVQLRACVYSKPV
jgi:hypothetical protein